MGTSTAIGALLVIAGLILTAFTAMSRGRMSKPRNSAENPAGPTLEPARRNLGFLGVTSNWPGIVLTIIGIILLLAPILQAPLY